MRTGPPSSTIRKRSKLSVTASNPLVKAAAEGLETLNPSNAVSKGDGVESTEGLEAWLDIWLKHRLGGGRRGGGGGSCSEAA